MFTRCPNCHNVHPINSALLANAGGRVRCGRCDTVFFSLTSLFDEWPESDGQAPAMGLPGAPPPTLGLTLDMEYSTAEDLHPLEDGIPVAKSSSKWPWVTALAVLLLVTIANLGWNLREPLLQNPQIRAWAESARLVEPVEPEPFKDPGQIQLVSRDMHAHPSRTGILVLSATLVNNAPLRQVLPEIEITLTNSGGQAVAHRLFAAKEYLPPGTDPQKGIETGAYLPVLLEFADPGNEAVGFELSFR
jgi:predicted Zn finger-like uncharacterized protein